MAVLHVKSPNGTQTNVDLNNVGNPIGSVQAFAGSTIPTGWLLCDGSAVSRTTYAALFAVIGTTYGTGNGSTTFNLPNLINIFIQGAGDSDHNVGEFINPGLPDIQAYFRSYGRSDAQYTNLLTEVNGAMYITDHGTDLQSFQLTASYGSSTGYQFSAYTFNHIYGASNTVQPPAIMMNYIIKY